MQQYADAKTDVVDGNHARAMPDLRAITWNVIDTSPTVLGRRVHAGGRASAPPGWLGVADFHGAPAATPCVVW